jgi:hypothetical protein
MNRYTITYVQEVTQPVDAENIQDAGVFAKRYAAKNRMVVLQIYAEQIAQVDPPPRSA